MSRQAAKGQHCSHAAAAAVSNQSNASTTTPDHPSERTGSTHARTHARTHPPTHPPTMQSAHPVGVWAVVDGVIEPPEGHGVGLGIGALRSEREVHLRQQQQQRCTRPALHAVHCASSAVHAMQCIMGRVQWGSLHSFWGCCRAGLLHPAVLLGFQQFGGWSNQPRLTKQQYAIRQRASVPPCRQLAVGCHTKMGTALVWHAGLPGYVPATTISPHKPDRHSAPRHTQPADESMPTPTPTRTWPPTRLPNPHLPTHHPPPASPA